MKRVTTNLILAATALVAASCAASAQSLTAEVPFSFRAGNKVMPPGTYKVTTSPGEQWFQLRDLASHQTTVLMALNSQNPPSDWQKAGRAALGFACNDRHCALNRIWTARGYEAHRFAVPRAENDPPTRLAVIRLMDSGGAE